MVTPASSELCVRRQGRLTTRGKQKGAVLRGGLLGAAAPVLLPPHRGLRALTAGLLPTLHVLLLPAPWRAVS